MSEKKVVERNYKMPDADLMQLGDKAVSLIARDAAELAPYGIDAADSQFIAGKTQEFKDFATDEELEGAVTIATQAKDATAELLKTAVRSIMVRVHNAFGEQSGVSRRFGAKGMNKLNDNDLYRLGKRIARMAAMYLAQLATEGLTQAIIDQLIALTASFDDAIDVKSGAVKERDISTEDRIELGNLLYDKIVKVFEAGKDYWVSRDEAKYNDYVISEGNGGAPPPPTLLTFLSAVTNQNVLQGFNIGIRGEAVTPKDGLAGRGDAASIIWGDGNTSDITLDGTTQNTLHSYVTPGIYTIELKGSHPERIIELLITHASLTGAQPANNLSALEILNLEYNPIVNFTMPTALTALTYVSFFQDALSVTSINSILQVVNGFNTAPAGASMLLHGGTNAAPTGQGNAAKNQLESRGWSVATN